MGVTGQARAEYIAIHEFGHVLGFRHEQDRIENTGGVKCGQGIWMTVDNGTAWTPYDQNSIMNYCSGNGTTLSRFDVIGIRKAYGFHQKDFNGDLGADVLWHHGAIGQLSAWLVGGGNVLGTTEIDWQVASSTGWRAVGTGDCNLDGKPDVLWQHLSNNWVNVWLLDGGHVTNNPTVPTPGLSAYQGWNIVGTGDFNSDGSTDILWYNPGPGVVKAWMMQGTNVIGVAD